MRLGLNAAISSCCMLVEIILSYLKPLIIFILEVLDFTVNLAKPFLAICKSNSKDVKKVLFEISRELIIAKLI